MILHRLRLPSLAALAAAVPMLAGCASDRVVVDDIGVRYSRVEFSAAADGRDLRTVIQGNPFGTPGFDQAVLGIMNRTYVGPKTNFTATPGPTAKRDYFVSVVFNPSPDVTPFALCNAPIPTAAPNPGRITARAAFCITGGEATAVTGYVSNVKGPDDPNFVSMIQHMMLAMFPY
ncbi:hypothetical protein FFK22_006015 [Mycobacterium sp. KBS0706]|uniref:hypothetical protein n=1 Tax=Mycobacterium sp. KBS0706 TaxID=2578109 RepID=UPI00110F6DC3|nr:hypothetical protein [Mycobacterium sp. KBS0706]TSD89560.1 hypothetical protein FFK22_006015 [Mycobacterium sp. KBS0706]